MASPDLNEKMERYEGKFLQAADLMKSPPITVIIADVVAPNTDTDANKKLIDRPILTLKSPKSGKIAGKRFIVNTTNKTLLKAMISTKATEWIGHEITLGVRYLKKAFGESNVPTIRIIPPAGFSVPFGSRKHMGSAEPFGPQTRDRDDYRDDREEEPERRPEPVKAPLLDDRKPAPVAVKPVDTGNKPDADMVEDLKQRIAQVALENGDSEREVSERLLVYTKNSKPVTAPSPEWFLAGETEDERINRHDWLLEVYTAAFK